MPKKKTTKKPTKKSAKKFPVSEKQKATVELGPNELRIRFDRPDQIVPKLLELAGQLSESHRALSVESAAAEAVEVLGTERASIIVSSCAQSTAWTATLQELGLNPLLFRNCVATGIDNAGFAQVPFPATPSTRLVDVVIAIQGAPRK